MSAVIYADNAATTALDGDAFEAMKPFLTSEYGNASQPYSFSRSAKKALKGARETVALCINASPEEIFFTSGGTESDNWAIKGSCVHGDVRATMTSRIEHHAILNACAAIERFGFPVAYLPVDGKGILSPDVLDSSLKNAKLVSVMMANNEIGTLEPVADLARVAHDHGALFHTDAVQAVGHVPVDVKSLSVDMLSASGHKFNAPKGVGFLFVKKGTPLLPFSDGGAQEFGLRAGTENVASIVGMAVALQKNCARMESAKRRLLNMEREFLSVLTSAKVDYLRNGASDHIPGNINVSFRGANGEMLLHRLDLKGICVSTGSACDSVNDKLSHVIQEISVPKDYARGTIRISLAATNDEGDAVKIAQALVEILSRKN